MEEPEHSFSSFDFALLSDFAVAKSSIQREELEEAPKYLPPYYPLLKRELHSFSLMDEIRNIFCKEWEKSEEKKQHCIITYPSSISYDNLVQLI